MAESSGTSGTEKELIKNCTAIDGLRHSQTYTALFLHLSLLASSYHPDIAKVIRLTAHSARVQHSLALDCMVKFLSNSKHVVDTLLPVIVEGIDNNMPELITGAFEEIKTIAERMLTEAEKTVQRYDEIQLKVQDTIGNIKTEDVKLKKKLEKIREDKKKAEARVKDADGKIETKTKDVARYTRDHDRLCKEKELFLGAYSKTLDNEDSNDIFGTMVFPTEPVYGLVATGAILALKLASKSYQVHKAVAQIDKSEEEIQLSLEKQSEGEMGILKYKQEKRDAVYELERLAMAEDNAADVTGLITANDSLGEVYHQLVRISEFWEQMVVCIEKINNDTRAVFIYKERSKLLRSKVIGSKNNWKTFIDVCDKYIRVCKHDDSESVGKLYAFLSEPMDSMTKAERRKRQSDIAEQLKKRIEELGTA